MSITKPVSRLSSPGQSSQEGSDSGCSIASDSMKHEALEPTLHNSNSICECMSIYNSKLHSVQLVCANSLLLLVIPLRVSPGGLFTGALGPCWVQLASRDTLLERKLFYWSYAGLEVRSLQQESIDLTGTETRQIFFSYVCNGTKLNSCFHLL